MKEVLAGSTELYCGDNRDVLRGMADCSVDSIVTDPPYALVSIAKRFSADNAAPVVVPQNGSGAYARVSRGFMNQTWDVGEVAFDPAFWAECLRVLKPGGYICAFGGDRTFHRLYCAIEDAGAEPRHTIAWLFGSGFPKNHSIAKHLKDQEWCECD